MQLNKGEATAAVLAAIALLRSLIKFRIEEKHNAEQLVQVVLKRLQDQVCQTCFPGVKTDHVFRSTCTILIR